jgi:hypothetical protein
MTENEHRLVVFMFAQQATRFKALLELLRARGILEGDDLAAFEHVVRAEMDEEIYVEMVAEYTKAAKDFGIQDSLPKPAPY